MVTINGVGPKVTIGRCGRARGSTPTSPRFNKMTLQDIAGNLRGKVVLVRCDFNVLDGKNHGLAGIKSDDRLLAALPTITFLAERGARVILLSHAGRNEKIIKKPDLFTLAPVAERLSALGSKQVRFVDQTVGPKVSAAVSALPNGGVLLLENTRMDARDEAKDTPYAEEIAATVRHDIGVFDGFAVAHRAEQASVKALSSSKTGLVIAGECMRKEIEMLGTTLLDRPEHPFLAILGGSKVGGKEGKLGLIEVLLEKVDKLLIAGAMTYPFLIESGLRPGKDPITRTREEPLSVDKKAAAKLLKSFRPQLIVPTQIVFENEQAVTLAPGVRPPKGLAMRDIGEAALLQIFAGMTQPQTVFWNGTAGKNEDIPFDAGTNLLARKLNQWAITGTSVVIGGGDTGKAFKEALRPSATPMSDNVHISTGGGASVDFIRTGGQIGGYVMLSDRN